MTAIEVLRRVRERGVELRVDGAQLRYSAPPGALTAEIRTELGRRKTEILGLLADAARAVRIGADRIPRRPREGEIPLSFAQERLWFLDRLFPGSSAYNCQRVLRLRGRLDVAALERALDEIVRRHDTLRTVYPAAADGTATARRLGAAAADLRRLDLASRSGDERRRAVVDEIERPFRIDVEPPFRVTLLRFAPADHVLVLVFHHIATDGPSLKLFLRELGVLYAAFVRGSASPLEAPVVQYADFAAWQRARVAAGAVDADVEYWKRRLADVPDLELPADAPRPERPSGRGGMLRFGIPAATGRALRALAAAEATTPFVVLLAAFHTLLYRLSGETDLVVGAPLTARTRTELEPLIGFFYRTLIVRVELAGPPTFRELVGRVRAAVLEAWSHSELPFQKLVEALNPDRRLDRTPLYSTMFAFEEADPELRLAEVEAAPVRVRRTTTIVDLDLTVRAAGDGFAATLSFATDRFRPSTAARAARQFRALVGAVAASPDDPIDALALLGRKERQRLVSTWNATAASNHDPLVAERFVLQAAQTPEAIAIQAGGESVSYAELERRSARLAQALRAHGAAPGVAIAVHLERSLGAVVAVLAVLRAGSAYVPLDPRHPPARLRALLRDAGAPIVVSRRELAGSVADASVAVVCIDDERADAGEAAPASAVTAGDLAYVLYTSGSTGEPKGVEVTHAAFGNFVSWAVDAYAIGPLDRVLQYASIGFDTSVEEIFPALTRGATLVMRPGAVVESIPAFLELCATAGVTVLDLPTAYWHELTAHLAAEGARLAPSVRLCIIGGEAAHAERVSEWQRTTGIRLVNTYGPTEATVVATAFDLTHHRIEHERGVPIGRPIRNARAYVLDSRLEPVPIGVAGDLALGGVGLARGYRGRPDLTRERFVADPFSTEPGARLYRTGDRARWRSDGQLEFLGRNDAQVKLRGFRIELGEIEFALRRQPGVTDAVVRCVADSAGEKRLVAYLIGPSSHAIDVDELRRALKTTLPAYMVPAAFVSLRALPTNGSGKIDLRALPPPDRARSETTAREVVTATDAVEYQLARIWESVLNVRPVGTRDDFFDLGGHSLLALHLFAEIEKRMGVRLPLASLFQAGTIVAQAELVRGGPRPRDSAVVAIQPRGSKPPLFCVHAHEGNVLFYRDLARRLGPDQPFFALQSPGLDGAERPYDRVEDMAERYVRDIRTFQPRGPYFLGGYCFGGPVAFEVARQLSEQDQHVALLVLFDAYAPGYRLRKRSWIVRKTLRWTERAVLHATNVTLLPPGRKLAYAAGRVRKLLSRAYLRAGLPSSRDHRAVRESLRLAAERYQARSYAGDVVLFRADRLPSGYLHERSLGWDRLVTGRLEVHEVPGYYGTIILEPRVEAVVRPLERLLTRARSSLRSTMESETC